MDGCVTSKENRAGCRGVIRDNEGRWIGGFTMNIGSCTTDEAEALAMLKGLQVAHDKGIRRIEIRSDSKFITNMLNKDIRSYSQLNLASNILDKCKNMLQSFEDNKRILHVFREQIKVADAMAKLCYTFGSNLRVFDRPPPLIQKMLLDDNMGVPVARLIFEEAY